MNVCRGCLNKFEGHTPSADGIWCELCGTFNHFKEKNMTNHNCKIDQHQTDADGEHCECQYFIHLSDSHRESLVKLLDDEMSRNIANGDDAYNKHWENIKMALGYAIVK